MIKGSPWLYNLIRVTGPENTNLAAQECLAAEILENGDCKSAGNSSFAAAKELESLVAPVYKNSTPCVCAFARQLSSFARPLSSSANYRQEALHDGRINQYNQRSVRAYHQARAKSVGYPSIEQRPQHISKYSNSPKWILWLSSFSPITCVSQFNI